ncbi:extracellular sulfatase Sulf-1-like isoform X1 [Antedon mediterranea]|uniref:extracellular sulfatase Sulf-1-like isoform X1 n=1 Tax=Antedon mediterranea TaxID=105859 RepID=UPI003AF86829
MKHDIVTWTVVFIVISCKFVQSRPRKPPNIILILTDDQDVVLGSMSAMNKTNHHLAKNGANFINAFVTTPLCCPSRSSILTGMYEHNTGVFDNQETCVSKEWIEGPEKRNFGAYLQQNQYRTGYFGKYLNRYNGSHIPDGWGEWVALLQNSRYYNYSINRNGNIHRHGDNYYRDYFPDLIANDSLTFFRLSKMNYPELPVAMVVSFPGPHGPEDGAPHYQHLFEGNQLHRTTTWNHVPNPDKHWIIQVMEPMTDLEIAFTDALQRKRLITLVSVDDAIQKLCQELESIGELDNTYIIFTSDHGYHLGQFGLVKGKSMPYDFDLRVPFLIRGPGIPQGVEVPNMVLSIDLAPTILDMAGILIPEHMDGMSILKLFEQPGNRNKRGPNGKKKKVFRYVGTEPWRDTFLVERSRTDEELERYYNKTARLGMQVTKGDKLREECEKPEYQPPCKPKQAKECILLADGSYQIRKCRKRELPPTNENNKKCVCPNEKKKGRMNKEEKKQQRTFLKQHVNKENIKLGPFIEGEEPSIETPTLGTVALVNDDSNIYQADSALLNHVVVDPKCQVFPNSTVYCISDVFSSRKSIQEHKAFLQRQIDSVQTQLKYLRVIKNSLKDAKVIKKEKLCVCPKENDKTENIYAEERQTSKRKKNQKTQERESKSVETSRSKRRGRKGRKELVCNKPNMNCWQHDRDHWRTPPYWTDEMICGCTQSNNNTYWCLRTINKTHDFLYCEFITKFVEFFNHRTDPHQTTNLAHSLDTGIRRQLHEQLADMKACVGSKDCTTKSLNYNKKQKATNKKQKQRKGS